MNQQNSANFRMDVTHAQTCSPQCDPDQGIHVLVEHTYDPPQEAREHIPDPTVKTSLPKNLLSALGNAHVNLQLQVREIVAILNTIGWPNRDGELLYDLDGPPLSNALDYARENARLTWVLCGLVDDLKQSLGEMVWGEDEIGHPILECMGNDCEHDENCAHSPRYNTAIYGNRHGRVEVEMTAPAQNGSFVSFYPVDRKRPAPPSGAPRPVIGEEDPLRQQWSRE